jgi:hypothetical protein
MNPSKNKRVLLAAIWAVLVFGAACTNDEPAVIFDPDDPGAPTPVITAVDPSDEAVAGVTRVKITGSNFLPSVSQNFVYFGNALATILAASTTELTVVPPNIVSDNLTIRVVVQNAFLPAEFGPYRLKAIALPYGNLGRVRVITMDRDENLFASPSGSVVKLAPDLTVTPYGTLSFPTASTMRIGPDGSLFVQRNRNIRLYRIAPGGGAVAEFIRFPQAVSYFDFDPDGNIFAGGDNGLFVLTPSNTIRAVGQYPNIPIKSVRVFNGYVYVAIAGSAPAVLRNQILAADGSLGSNESVFDWASSGSFSAFEISDITFAEDGDLYIAAEGKPADPILIVHPDGSSETLYPGVLTNFPVADFVWGNGQLLYVNHDNDSGVSSIAMGKNGAPYYGRQ